ncbi:dienelactone hydrolase family protein [Candidatus Magnetaquicoccus inordinatus]|uniref:dienelactone hydrolase family protein n=1 Tax=Candidatus Magnetaquicoccus inordinatus TaxID=2496818 RepID=UPI00102CE652|nr:dienelactone hydrolase family protein [Candidatus Magnetaquicoccus inordinatus]
MLNRLILLALCLFPQLLFAAMVEEKVKHSLDGVSFESVLVYDDAVNVPRPAVLMVPNWLGVTAQAVEQAKQIAAGEYVLLVADLYGENIRPKNSSEAQQAAGMLRGNRPLLRARANHALDTLLSVGQKVGLHPQQTAAIGFCFGGGTVLELARSGRDLKGVVSFHGNLDTPNPADAAQIKAAVLVLHGADDPLVPPAQVAAFEAEMKAHAHIDWQLVSFGGAVHSFTDPEANTPGKVMYHERTAKRAFVMMHKLFAEIF